MCFRSDTGFCKNRSKAAAFDVSYNCQAWLLDCYFDTIGGTMSLFL